MNRSCSSTLTGIASVYTDEHGWIDDSTSCLRREFLPEHLEPNLQRAGFYGSILVQARNAMNPEHAG
jgi:hypothetical protein